MGTILSPAAAKFRKGKLALLIGVDGDRLRVTLTATAGGRECVVGEQDTTLPVDTPAQVCYNLCRLLMGLVWPVYEYAQTIDNPVVDANRGTLTISTFRDGPADFGTVEAFDEFVRLHTPPDLSKLVVLLGRIEAGWLDEVPTDIRSEVNKMAQP